MRIVGLVLGILGGLLAGFLGMKWLSDAHQMREHNGFAQDMERLSPSEHTFDVMRPYGVWAVIAPFNFPMALAIAPVAAALIVGNTVVLKPSEQGAVTSILGDGWETRVQPLGPTLATLSLRTTPSNGSAVSRRRQRSRSAAGLARR